MDGEVASSQRCTISRSLSSSQRLRAVLSIPYAYMSDAIGATQYDAQCRLSDE
jgi:hypothetical protein